MRVKVWNGDKSKFLGFGNYVSNVSVYAILMPNGTICSASNAEEKPESVPEGGVVRELPENPKIILDNGKIVYGCQVWWQNVEEIEEIEEIEEETQYDPWAECEV
jgi:hypothetical protein